MPSVGDIVSTVLQPDLFASALRMATPLAQAAYQQYFATLAIWFGVDNSNLTTVFPNLGRFASSNLGFI